METKKTITSIDFSDKEKNSSKQVFIITPIGEQNSEIRDEADALINGIIKPTLFQLGFLKQNLFIPHEMLNAGSITRDIVKLVFESDLVIANLTGENPNVYYEVAIRHFSQKPLILMGCEGTNVRFDVADQRVLFYTTQMSKSEEYRTMLNEAILELNTFEGTNIISSYPQYEEIKKRWAEQGDATISSNLGEQILKSIDSLHSRVNNIERSINEDSLSRSVSEKGSISDSKYENRMEELKQWRFSEQLKRDLEAYDKQKKAAEHFVRMLEKQKQSEFEEQKERKDKNSS